MPSPRIMIVEDEFIVALDIRTRLEDLGYDVPAVASSGEEAVAKANELRPDLILMDIMLRGQMDGIEASREIRRRLNIPCVFLTAHADNATLQRAKETGPFGYIIKPFEQKELRSSIEIALFKHLTEKQLFESRHWLATILGSMSDGVIATDGSGRITFMNEAAIALSGWIQEEALGRKIDEVIHLEDEASPAVGTREGVHGPIQARILTTRSNSEISVGTSSASLHDQAGQIVGNVLVIRDNTAGKQAEEYARKTERLQSIAQLSGGIAHEFNNLLTVIRGRNELLLSQLPAEGTLRVQVEEIDQAASRAAALTRQMMAFSRQQILHPVVIDLCELVRSLEPELKALLGEGVELVLQHDGECAVEADPEQLSFALRELASNARVAMPQGGRFGVRVSNVALNEEFVHSHPGSRLGSSVLLEVSDTGVGMSSEIQKRIFEPFFSTQGRASRPGMGLATVYGIIKQSRGNLYVESREGKGTTFMIYLPVAGERPGKPKESQSAVTPSLDAPTVLLVEDEPGIRTMIAGYLSRKGFEVHTFAGAAEALTFASGSRADIDILVTDVVMPGMSGRELAERLVTQRPEMRVLFTSGYPEGEALEKFPAAVRADFLHKPYSLDALLSAIRKLIAGDETVH